MKKTLLCLAVTALLGLTANAQIGVVATGGTPTGTYPTLKGAFDAVNAGTHQGAVTIFVNGDTTETATAQLNGSTAPANYTSVLITPGLGVTATITGSITSAVIKLNGADNVTINGSNNGSSSRNLTISNTYVATTGTTPVVIMANSLAAPAVDGANNFTIRNTNIAGSTPAGTIGGIIVSGSTLAAAETPNNNFTAINNTFVRAQNAIFAIGNTTNTDTGWIIRNNEIGSTVAADKMLFRGIAVQNAKNFEVSGNVIKGVVITSTSTSTGMLIGAAVTNGNIFNNTISDIKNTNAGGYGAAGITLNSSSTTANLLIYNNIISGVAGYGYPDGGAIGDNGNGIFVSNGAGYKIYYNTVVMDANQNVAGRPSAFNVAVAVTTPGAIDLRNNIFVNTQTTTGARYAIYSAAPNTVFSNINNNDYYTTGPNLGFLGTATLATLADIQTGFGQNTSSINVLPVFVSATNLRPQAIAANAPLDNKAAPVAEVTTDADGTLRSVLTPDLGGFEFSAPLSAEEFTKTTIAYNNPVTDYLNVTNSTPINTLEVFTITGQHAGRFEINATEGSADLRNLAAGVYIVKATSADAAQTIKIIKK
ncbi:MAG: beta strand repeat-containing protein [Flavobacterium sp.]